MSHLKKIISTYKNWKKSVLSNNRFVAIIAALFIVLVSMFLFSPNSSRLVSIEKIDPPLPPPYMVNIFENEETIKPPFDFTLIQQPQFPNKSCNIINYGAIGDGKILNTLAFNDAIEDCAKSGGGVVEVPAGQWLTGSIRLESNINLHLDKDAVVIFSKDPQKYLPTVFSRYEGVEYNGFSPFIHASNCQNIAITGSGKLDGQGRNWWPKNNMLATYALYDMGDRNVPVEERVFDKESMMIRPSFVQFENCKSILLEDFTIANSPMWTIHPLYSSNILMRNLNINTLGLNTDGIAIDSSSNILIEDSTILSGDDAIAIKAGRDLDGLRTNIPSENIIIRNCNIIDGHSGLSIGSETSGSIRNVFIYNEKIRNATFAIRLKSSIGRGGTVENIWASNITADKISSGCIQLTTDYDDPRTPNNVAEPTFRNVHFDNVTCKKSSDSITVLGLQNNPIENITFRNIEITAKNGASFINANNIRIFNSSIKNKGGIPQTYQVSNAQNMSIDEMDCSQMNDTCVELKKKNN